MLAAELRLHDVRVLVLERVRRCSARWRRPRTRRRSPP
ncbi:hypothetical protein F7P10_03000 [Actinomadura sp. WMMB 499]|nr:hypothetical protein F7P10_03000 [Actinomadura sp. WMMB 499]